MQTWNKTPEEIAEMKAGQRRKCQATIDDISADDFNKSFVNKLLSLFHVKQGSQLKAWGQFREKLPHKWYTK
jgi:hypothetical protein